MSTIDPGAPILDTRERVTARKVSAAEMARAALDRAQALQKTLNAFVDLFPDQAMEQARAVDARIARGEPVGALAGVPVAIKDNMSLAYGRTTCCSRILENYRAPYTATAVQKLIDAGAIIVGKTTMDEFAMGSSGEHSCFGPTRNPWDLSRVPGGSSSGSTAAVAAGIVPASLGSDTGGSIRQPAGLCGIYGLKPTYGLVSRYGLVAFASSLDQIGPLTRTVDDLAAMLSVIMGHDDMDSTSATAHVDAMRDLHTPVDGLTLGVPRQARSTANTPGVAAALEAGIKTFRDLGARIIDIDLPHIDHGIAAYYIIAPAEASSNLARFDGVRYGRRAQLGPGEDLMALYCKSRSEGFGPEVQRRIMLGTHVLSSGYFDAYYLTALKVRRLIKNDYDAAFKQGCHAILMPSSPSPAFTLGSKTSDPLAMYLEDVYTVGVNLAGLPGLTMPGGFEKVTDNGRAAELPVGLQLVGPALGENTLLRIAAMFADRTTWHTRRPAI